LGNLGAAVAEAAWMTGLERNGDVVTTASYAPLFTNDNHERAWTPDAIVFNSYTHYGTPSYWNQLLFMNSFNTLLTGTVRTLSYQLNAPGIYVSVTYGVSRMTASTLVLVHKIVNTNSVATALDISITNLPSSAKLNPQLDLVLLTGKSATEENTFANPNAIIPASSTVSVTGPSFTYNAPPLSVTVVRAYAAV